MNKRFITLHLNPGNEVVYVDPDSIIIVQPINQELPVESRTLKSLVWTSVVQFNVTEFPEEVMRLVKGGIVPA